MKVLHAVAFLLLVVGGLNWGLVGLGNFLGNNWNVVSILLGTWPVLENSVYVLVGLSAILILFTHKGDCRSCAPVPATPAA
ncbi:MAG: DUF378 domain-containing protein [Minisyncoccia bacterium]